MTSPFLVNGTVSGQCWRAQRDQTLHAQQLQQLAPADPTRVHSESTGDPSAIRRRWNTIPQPRVRQLPESPSGDSCFVDYTYNYYKGRVTITSTISTGRNTRRTIQLPSLKPIEPHSFESLSTKPRPATSRTGAPTTCSENPMQTLKNVAGGDSINRVDCLSMRMCPISMPPRHRTTRAFHRRSGQIMESELDRRTTILRLTERGRRQATTIKSGFDYNKHGIHRFTRPCSNSYGSDESRSYDDR